jgi:hypothetical protein
MNAIPPLSPLGESARAFIHNHNLAGLHDILLVAVILAKNLDRALGVFIEFHLSQWLHFGRLGERTRQPAAIRGQSGGSLLGGNAKMQFRLELLGDFRGPSVCRLRGPQVL